MLLTAAIVLPRSLSIASHHSESYDDQYHLVRGLVRFTGERFRDSYNDPPLGEMILAIPMWATGCTLEASSHDPAVVAHHADPHETILYGQKLSPEKLLLIETAWKALLFLPGAAVIFLWCRRLYGLHAAWLALGAVLADPPIAAHTSILALDVLSAEAILIASYLAWRYFQTPTIGRLIGVCAAIAAAMLIKIPATIVLIVFAMFALLYWWIRPRAALPQSRRRAIGLAVLLIPLCMWAFTLFDISPPNEHAPEMSAVYSEHWNFAADVVNANSMRRWPLGIYIASLIDSQVHAAEGHRQYLLGQVSAHGWWYYQFVTSALKIPIGIAVFLLIGLLSLIKVRFRFEEWSLLVPAILAGLLLIVSPIDVGFRHAITTYILLIMLASRCTLWMTARKWIAPIAWLGIAASAAQGFAWHPDEFAFVNLPWPHPQAIISDSNTDWGQSLKQVRQWIDAHPNPDKPVYVAYFGPDTEGVAFDHYLDHRALWLGDDPPHHGLLIVSPVLEWGAYAPPERYAAMRNTQPIAIIGHCMRVYDLDAIFKNETGDNQHKIE